MKDLAGIYIAKVLNNIDNLKQERIFCRILGIHNIEDNFSDKTYGIWIENGLAIRNFSGNIPDVDDMVYIMFVNNNPMTAIYFGIVRNQV
jgi:hypothetical protein